MVDYFLIAVVIVSLDKIIKAIIKKNSKFNLIKAYNILKVMYCGIFLILFLSNTIGLGNKSIFMAIFIICILDFIIYILNKSNIYSNHIK